MKTYCPKCGKEVDYYEVYGEGIVTKGVYTIADAQYRCAECKEEVK